MNPSGHSDAGSCAGRVSTSGAGNGDGGAGPPSFSRRSVGTTAGSSGRDDRGHPVGAIVRIRALAGPGAGDPYDLRGVADAGVDRGLRRVEPGCKGLQDPADEPPRRLVVWKIDPVGR